MKRKPCLLVFVILSFMSLVSCSYVQPKRTVTVSIPQHSWEINTGRNLWYTLRWTDSNGTNSLHLTQDQRVVELSVDPGRTVFIVAFPLGDMSPFGAIITPKDQNNEVTLTQEDGYLASLLYDLDSELTGMINYGLILGSIHEKTDDIRKIDDVSLLRDIQNGEMSASSVKVLPDHLAGPFALANGIWESEFLKDPGIVSIDGMANPLPLPTGVFRFLNSQNNMILVLIVDRDGNYYSYLREAQF